MVAAMNRRVAILAFDGCQSLDVLGPLEVFHGAGVRLREQASLSPSYDPLIVGFTECAVRSESGARITPDQTLQALLGKGEPPLDTWIVPGGHGVERLLEDRAAIAEIAQVARIARRTGSVCTGAFLLGAAGLLHGRRATTHWAYCAELARAFPAVEVDTDSIFVRDGDVFSSAGVTAGIDLSLALVEDDLGRELACQVAKWLVVYVRRTGAEPQISGPLAVQAAARPGMRELATWVTAHSSEDLSVGALARRAGMSVRNFARVFREELHETPSSFVERVRTTSARRLMDTTDKSLEEIADLVGFASATALRQAFRRRFGRTPTELRAPRTT